MLQLLCQKLGVPCLFLSVGAAGLFLSVILSPPDEGQSVVAPPGESQGASFKGIAPPDDEPGQCVHSDLLEPQVLKKEKEDLFWPLILEAAQRYDVEPELIRAVIMTESRFDARAVSAKGAKGLMQLMPLTAKAMGVEDVFDPQGNISGGVKYLRMLLDSFQGNVTLALAAYHAGGSRVRKHRGVPPIRATRHYVTEVSRYYDVYKKGGEG